MKTQHGTNDSYASHHTGMKAKKKAFEDLHHVMDAEEKKGLKAGLKQSDSQEHAPEAFSVTRKGARPTAKVAAAKPLDQHPAKEDLTDLEETEEELPEHEVMESAEEEKAEHGESDEKTRTSDHANPGDSLEHEKVDSALKKFLIKNKKHKY